MASDVFFISYDEPNAEKNWRRLLSLCPYAKRVHGVTGIREAHQAAAAQASTSHFFVVDGDSEPTPVFDFGYEPDHPDRVHVWMALNPVNGMTYGYGGIKLFPTQPVRDVTEMGVDFTTSLGPIVAMERIGSVHRFNTSAFHSWRAGFRECVKLASRAIDEDEDHRRVSKARLEIWCTFAEPTAAYALELLDGAADGRDYGTQNAGDPVALSLINDIKLLEQRFRKYVD